MYTTIMMTDSFEDDSDYKKATKYTSRHSRLLAFITVEGITIYNSSMTTQRRHSFLKKIFEVHT